MEEAQPRYISLIVPYCNQDKSRLPALQALLNCIASQDFYVTDQNNNPKIGIKAFEFIFIEHKNSPDYKTVEECGIDIKKYADKYLVVEYHSAFNKSWVMNVAARASNYNLLAFVDADMLFGKEYIFFVNVWRATYPAKPPKFFVGWNWIMKLPGKDEPVIRMVRDTALTAGGIFWVDKDFYWEIGGMNENYFGYGGEDNDFWIRANFSMGDRELKNVPNVPYPIAHTYHDNAIPSEKRFYFLNRTVQKTDLVIEKLKHMNLGNPIAPTVCDFSNIILEEEGLENKDGKGLI